MVHVGRSRLLLAVGLLLALFLVGCSGDQATVEVSVTGLPPRLDHLDVTARIDGARLSGPSVVAQRPDSFLVRFPNSPGRRGTLTVHLDALDLDLCLIAAGEQPLALDGSDQYQMQVALVALPQKACRLELSKSEGPSGTVTSDPPGLLCGPACTTASATYPPGTQVVLHATPDSSAYFAGWLGACYGTGPCVIDQISNTPQRVIARFVPRRVCTAESAATGAAGWCWENPLPEGNPLQALWGSSAIDIWAVGGHGGLLRWNGALWAPYRSPTTAVLESVWGSGANDVWAVGHGATILHWDGLQWSQVPAPAGVTDDLLVVFGTGADQVFAAGDHGAILRWDGAAWRPLVNVRPTNQPLYAAWGSGPSDVWLAGQGSTFLRWDGAALRKQTPVTLTENNTEVALTIYDLWGSAADDVWAVGATANLGHGVVLRWQGQRWIVAQGGPDPITGAASHLSPLYGVFGRDRDDVWLSGDNGTILRWDGAAVRPVQTGTRTRLLRTFGVRGDDLWAVGLSGSILRWNGTFFLSAGSSSVTDAELTSVWGSDADNLFAVGQSGTLLQRRQGAWLQLTGAGAGAPFLSSVHGTSAQDVWAVGQGGAALRWSPTDASFALTPTPTTQTLLSVWSAGPGEAWVVGSGGTLLRWDGRVFRAMPTGVTDPLFGVWRDPAGLVWAVGWNGAVLLGDASGFSLARATGLDFQAVWGSGADDVWLAGRGGLLVHWDGADLTSLSTGTTHDLYRIVGTGPNDVWFVGEAGTLLRWDGRRLSAVDPGTNATLEGVFALGADVWVVGAAGTILHRVPAP